MVKNCPVRLLELHMFLNILRQMSLHIKLYFFIIISNEQLGVYTNTHGETHFEIYQAQKS